MKEDAVKIFQESYSIYQKIIAQNLMYHSDIIKRTTYFFKKKLMNHEPLNILELGCGDGYIMSQCLPTKGFKINYQGYDLSTPFLNLAEKRLNSLPIQAKFIAKNIQDIDPSSFTSQLIYSSFVIHHLSLVEKQNMFKKCFKISQTKGFLLYFDIVRQPNQSFSEYFEAYMNMVKKDWSFNLNEIDLIYNHIKNYDFPEELETYTQQITKAGFSIIEKNYFTHFYMYIFAQKP